MAGRNGELAEQVLGGLDALHTLDVISGNAGAIPVLLNLARRPGLEALEPLAVALGEELCREACWEGERCFWEGRRMTGQASAPPGTGLAHGASGCALALMLLHAYTGRPEFLRTARGAFAFEDALFSRSAGNWVDAWGRPASTPSRARRSGAWPRRACGWRRRRWRRGSPSTGTTRRSATGSPGSRRSCCSGASGSATAPAGPGPGRPRRSSCAGTGPGATGPRVIGYHLLLLCDPKGVPPVLALTVQMG